MKKFIQNNLVNLSLILFVSLILALAIRGIAGSPTEQNINEAKWKDNGPFELSPDRGRFALMYSLVENKSFQFSLPIARFAVPDVAYANGQYVSLFAPALSFLIAPGYLIGKYFGIGQVGSFAVISLFSIINLVFVRAIAIRLGANALAATIAGLVFLFATPAFPYAVSLYQHHVSTFLILFSIYSLMRWKGLWPVVLVWLLSAFSVTVDNPNFVFMAPIAMFSLSRIIILKISEKTINFEFKILGLLTFFAAILPLAFFLWFNQMSHNNALKLSGTLPAAKDIDYKGKPFDPRKGTQNETVFDQERKQKSASGFFKTRNMLNGFYLHFASSERGMVYYAPVLFIAFLGIRVISKRNQDMLAILLGVVGANVLLYSMWGDPWGGWAFGSRYLIPVYAILSIFLALALSRYRKNIFVIITFFLLLIFSLSVNTLGAITTNTIPPKVEAVALEQISGRQEKFSFDRNIDYLNEMGSKSYLYNSYFSKHLDVWQYYFLILLPITGVCTAMLVYLRFLAKEKENARI